VAAEDETTGTAPRERGQRTVQAFTVTRRPRGRGRPLRPRLAEGQVDAQRGDASRGQRIRDRAQHGRLAVRAGAVGEHRAVARRRARPVQDAAHDGVTCALFERLDVGHYAGA